MPTPDNILNILNNVDSTNNYAMQKVYAGLAKPGEAYFAHFQSAGKGQRGKHWMGEEGKNIALSIVIKPSPLNITEQFYLSAAVALGCFDFFCKYAGDETSIKWPNDIYWRDRKAGGILIENVIKGKKWKWAVVGIGINVNQTIFGNELINPVSLLQITGKEYDPVELAAELHSSVLKRIESLFSAGKMQLIEEYNRHLYKLNGIVKLKKGNMVFETIVKGVDENGCLETADTIGNKYDFGDVDWIL